MYQKSTWKEPQLLAQRSQKIQEAKNDGGDLRRTKALDSFAWWLFADVICYFFQDILILLKKSSDLNCQKISCLQWARSHALEIRNKKFYPTY